MTRKILIQIEGMECPNCAMILERLEDKLRGVVFAEASYHRAQMIVEYDETCLGEDQIRQAIEKLGYKAGAITEKK
jgi:copper chaperone CopZ